MWKGRSAPSGLSVSRRRGGGEENRGPPLHVGNKTPVWSTARPILVPEIMKLCDPP